MDKKDALTLCNSYLNRIREMKINIKEVWLFGSYSKGNFHKDSDIDIALILNDNEIHTFDTDVKMMTLREGEETMIEPHVFSKEEFDNSMPIVQQVLEYGEKLHF